MKQWIINVILLVLSVTAILVARLKVAPFDITAETYIGTIATFIGISVSILIGYQVYNAIEMRGQLEKQKDTSKKLQDLYDQSELKRIEQEAQMNEGFEILSALIEYNRGQSFIVCGNALLHMHGALMYSLNTERIDYDWIFKCIRQYLSEMSQQTFVLNLVNKGNEYYISDGEYKEMPLKEFINLSLKPLYDNDSAIRSHNKFPRIKIEYERIMRLLERRINEIAKDPSRILSPEEKDAIINPKY